MWDWYWEKLRQIQDSKRFILIWKDIKRNFVQITKYFSLLTRINMLWDSVGIKSKFAPWFIGPFEVWKRIGKIAYTVASQANMESIQNQQYSLLFLKVCSLVYFIYWSHGLYVFIENYNKGDNNKNSTQAYLFASSTSSGNSWTKLPIA